MAAKAISTLDVCQQIIRALKPNYPTITLGVSSKEKAAQEYVFISVERKDTSRVQNGDLYGGSIDVVIVLNILYDDLPDRLEDIYNKTDPSVVGSVQDVLMKSKFNDFVITRYREVQYAEYSYIEPNTERRNVRTNEMQIDYQQSYLNARVVVEVHL